MLESTQGNQSIRFLSGLVYEVTKAADHDLTEKALTFARDCAKRANPEQLRPGWFKYTLDMAKEHGYVINVIAALVVISYGVVKLATMLSEKVKPCIKPRTNHSISTEHRSRSY